LWGSRKRKMAQWRRHMRGQPSLESYKSWIIPLHKPIQKKLERKLEVKWGIKLSNLSKTMSWKRQKQQEIPVQLRPHSIQQADRHLLRNFHLKRMRHRKLQPPKPLLQLQLLLQLKHKNLSKLKKMRNPKKLLMILKTLASSNRQTCRRSLKASKKIKSPKARDLSRSKRCPAWAS